ncbi:YhgE/Pip domain-containing protein [Oceanobacillus kapialis]|uniref:YhgE/Pip domain-containing protein n=1 Tax=Oceanobacillus kapialis TaxID=481353 RepID=UPI00384FB6E3
MFKQEMRELFKRKSILTALIVLAFVPLLYCAIFLWAYWDPYGATDEIAIAVVNEDEEITFNGQTLTLGNSIMEKLKENNSFDWKFVSAQEASNGLENQEYYATIEIPNDFSKNSATAFTAEPVKPVINYTPNESKNFVVSMIGNSAVTSLEQEISSNLTYTYMQVLGENLNKMTQGISEMSNGVTLLSESMQELEQPLKQAITTNTNLNETQKEQLITSLGKLNTGSQGMVQAINNSSQTQGSTFQEGNLEMIANPVELNTQPYTDVPNYGHGFAPFTISLALFLGAMLITITFPSVTPFTKPTSLLGWFNSKYCVLVVMAILQALLIDVFLLTILDLQVGNAGYFILFTILASIAFMTFIHLLVSIFKEGGRLVTMILFIFQITSSGGIFPSEMTPGFLQKISDFLPMTYSISGFRALSANDDFQLMWQNVGVLSIFLALSLIGTILLFLIKFRKITKDHTDVMEAFV